MDGATMTASPMPGIRPVAILGSGPAALFAAHACNLAGVPFLILSNKAKSRLGGAQFLFAPIPGIHRAGDPDTFVKYVRRGDPEVYKRKAFGSLDVPWTPWTEGGQPEVKPAWRLADTYDMLYEVLEKYINEVEITPQHVDQWLADGSFNAIVSSVPLRAICRNPYKDGVWTPDAHRFVTQDILIHPEAFEESEPDTVIYDGTEEKSWYRTSTIFDQGGTEWNQSAKHPPVKPMYKDFKPISTTCDCWKGHRLFLPIGRRGRWDVEALSHHAFYDVMTLIGMGFNRYA